MTIYPEDAAVGKAPDEAPVESPQRSPADAGAPALIEAIDDLEALTNEAEHAEYSPGEAAVLLGEDSAMQPPSKPSVENGGAAAATPRITVLQPLTPLKDVELPRRPQPPEDERDLLGAWSAAMERALHDGQPGSCVRLAHIVLRELPRHLATYYRLIRAAWMLRRWDEGDAWGRRLLRADPASALAWRGVAMAAEFGGERARAHARWRRAFECDPYEPEVRAGLVRTSIDLDRMPALNEAAHAALLLRGYRWEQAAMTYSRLMQQEPRRLDFQTGYLLALWRLQALPDAYEMARRLVQSQPYLLAAWLVIDQEGDVNDKALARHPLSTMDPDGDYARMAMGIQVPEKTVRLRITAADKLLLDPALGEA